MLPHNITVLHNVAQCYLSTSQLERQRLRVDSPAFQAQLNNWSQVRGLMPPTSSLEPNILWQDYETNWLWTGGLDGSGDVLKPDVNREESWNPYTGQNWDNREHFEVTNPSKSYLKKSSRWEKNSEMRQFMAFALPLLSSVSLHEVNQHKCFFFQYFLNIQIWLRLRYYGFWKVACSAPKKTWDQASQFKQIVQLIDGFFRCLELHFRNGWSRPRTQLCPKEGTPSWLAASKTRWTKSLGVS